MKAKDVKIGDHLYSDRSNSWQDSYYGQRVVVESELGHWYYKDGEYVQSAHKTTGYRYATTFGVVVCVLGSGIDKPTLERRSIVTLGSLRGSWEECNALVLENRRRKEALRLAHNAKIANRHHRSTEVLAQAAELGISGWPHIGTDVSVSTMTINPEILSQMLTALKAQGWTLPTE
jgi:hypothetical protein